MFLDRKDISLDGIDLETQIPFIDAPVGYGKTKAAIDMLPQVFAEHTGKKTMNVLLLVPVTTVREQTIGAYSDRTEKAKYETYRKDGYYFKVQTACYASPANFLTLENKIDTKFDLVIIDELDKLVEWSASFPEYIELWKWIETSLGETIVCGLTATPKRLLWTNYALWSYFARDEDLFISALRKPLDAKYMAETIDVCSGIKIETFIHSVSATSDSKILVYTQSAMKCYELSKQVPNSGFIVSPYNGEIPEGETKTLAELANEQVFNCEKLRDYIVRHQELPQGIDCLFINDSCSVGLNIKDETVRTVICDSKDLSTTGQVQGRIRHNIDSLKIIYTSYKVRDYKADIAEAKAIQNDIGYLRCLYEHHQDKEPVKAYQDAAGEYRLNPFYVTDILYNNWIEEQIEDKRNYFYQIVYLAKDRQINFLDAKEIRDKASAAKSNGRIDWLEALGLLDKEENFFTSKELKELCSSIGLKKESGKDIAGVPTLIKSINASGLARIEKIGRKQINGKRPTCYRVAKIGGKPI